MPRPDVSDERIPQILTAAATIFAEYGVDGASMSQIANAANVSKATIYHYFDSKDALVETLVRQLFAQDQTELEQLMHTDGLVIDRILIYAEGLSQLLEGKRNLYPVFAEFKAIAGRRSPIQVVLSKYYSGYISAFEKIIEQGKSHGEIRQDVETSAVSLALVSLIEGSILLAFNFGKPINEIMVLNINVLIKGLKP